MESILPKVGRAVCWLFLGIVMWPLTGAAQWRPTRHFTVKDGLVQSQISDLTQDSDGYLWIATQGGLCRFDGRTFKRFSRAEGLPDNVINSVTTDGREVWVATDLSGAAHWNGSTLTSLPGLPETAVNLSGIHVFDDGTIVVSSRDGMSALRDGRWQALSEAGIFGLWSGDDRSVMATGRDLHQLNSDLELETVLEFDNDTVLMAAERNQDHLWVATAPHNIGLISEGGVEWTTPPIEGSIIVMLADSQGPGLWIGTDQGLWRSEGDGKVSRVSLNPGSDRVEISALLRDREGSIWVGTWGNGLFQIPSTPWTHFTMETGFPAQSAWAFSGGEDGCVWMATTDGGVVSWCEDHWGATLGLDDGLPSEAVYTVAHDSDGSLWVGTTDGVCRKSDQILRCWDTDDGLDDDFIRHLFPRRGGGMWMATDLGLALWDGVSWQFWGEEEGLPGKMVRSLAESPDGRLWMALDAVGIASFDGQSFSVIDQEDGLPTSRVWTLALSSRDQLLLGTDAGLWIRGIDEDGPGTVVGVADGLPNESVIAVVQDLNGNIWAGTTHGVSVVSQGGEVLRTFTAHEGLSDTEAAEGAAWLDRDGQLWLGLADGVTVVHPELLRRNLVAPEIVLEGIRANGSMHTAFSPISTSGGEEPLEIRVDPSVTHLRFDFSSPSFAAPELVRFRLALTCFGDEFGPLTTDRHVTYHVLPAGKYRFGVQAVNNDGIPSEKPLWVDLDVRPPWYQTRLFQASSIFIAAIFGAGMLHMRNRGRLRRHAWLENEVSKRTSELDLANRKIQDQNRQLTELSRTDPLTGMGNRRVISDVLPVEMSILSREIMRLGPNEPVTEYHAAMIMMIDLDHFKKVNDQWGHDIGDQALIRCAAVLEDEMRGCDQAVRWGGEEFIVLGRGLNRDGALQFVQRILNRFNRCHLDGPNGTEIPIRASFGFVQVPLGTTDFLPSDQWPRLIDLADHLMYLAKKRGRARSVGLMWKDVTSKDVSERHVIESALRDPESVSEFFDIIEMEPAPIL